MPIIRVVMPNGTTRPFREGTPKSVIEAAKRDMIASMQETPADHEKYRASRQVIVTGWDPDDTGEPESDGPAQPPETTAPDTFDGDEPWNADSQDPVAYAPVQRAAPLLTVEQVKTILPQANRADIANYLDSLNSAMAGMTREQQAAFLGQVRGENPRLLPDEDTTYKKEANIRKAFPTRFKGVQDVTPYLYAPEKFANFAYDRKNGNIPGTTDGYDYRGRGLLQISGRGNYADLGFGESPEALSATPDIATQASVDFWNSKGLNDTSANILDRAGFDKITRKINGPGMNDAQGRWDGYQQALKVFGLSP